MNQHSVLNEIETCLFLRAFDLLLALFIVSISTRIRDQHDKVTRNQRETVHSTRRPIRYFAVRYPYVDLIYYMTEINYV